jgi:uncharacterized iron-regulated protein
MTARTVVAACLGVMLGHAAAVSEPLLADAEVILIGEVHDNPAHHAVQAEIVAEIAPAALVFEMLTPEKAARVTPDLIADADAMAETLAWDAGGWPAFAMYHPIFAAAPQAAVFGGLVPRDLARQALRDGPTSVMAPEEIDRFGLSEPLPEAEQRAREAFQLQVHCDALPEDLLPGMVDIQRLRDARLAQAVLEALDTAGPPVIVITGNGHARKDWGVPVYLDRARPGLAAVSIGQSEAGAIDGVFDILRDAPSVDRPDPCAAFRAAE